MSTGAVLFVGLALGWAGHHVLLGRGSPGSGRVAPEPYSSACRRCDPPYDWQQERDL